MSRLKVAIIGTGVTGLSIGYHLPLINPLVEITFIDKGSKPGGRMATRRSRHNSELLFDHGAPFLGDSCTQGDFRKIMDEVGAVKEISFDIVNIQSLQQFKSTKSLTSMVLVGKDGIDQIPIKIFKSLKKVKESQFEHRVTEILTNDKKQLFLKFQTSSKVQADKQLGPFNTVFCCIPFPQAKSIKQELFSFEKYNQHDSGYNANWMILLIIPQGILFGENSTKDMIDFSAIKDSPISYAVKQNKKFEEIESSNKQNWTFYFSAKWSQQNIILIKQQVQNKFLKQILPQYLSNKQKPPKIQYITVHRWLYSSPIVGNKFPKALVSKDKRLIFAGDWIGNKKCISQCWELGRKIVEQLYPKVDSQEDTINSKL